MGKISVSRKRGEFRIVNKLSYPETVHTAMLQELTSGKLTGMLPVTVKEKHGKTNLECAITGMKPLHQYFTDMGTVGKTAFLNVVIQLIKAVKKCEENRVTPNNLDLRMDRCFVDPSTKALYCIYWPIVNNSEASQPQLFLKELPHNVIFEERENRSYLDSYLDFFNTTEPFSLKSFERLILSLLGEQSDQRSYAPSGELGKAEKAPAEEKPEMSWGYYPSVTESAPPCEETLSCSFCHAEIPKGARFCSHCGKEVNVSGTVIAPGAVIAPGTVIVPGTVVLNQINGGTVALDEAVEGGLPSEEPQKYALLIREKTGEQITVDKPVFQIGREADCDCAVFDNPYVGGHHAELRSRDGRCFLVDLNSMNKTYVNGQAISPRQETEIVSDTKLKFANEIFTFKVIEP